MTMHLLYFCGWIKLVISDLVNYKFGNILKDQGEEMINKKWIIVCGVLVGLIAVYTDIATNFIEIKTNKREIENIQSSQESNNDMKVEEAIEEEEILEEPLYDEEEEQYGAWRKYEGNEKDYVDEKTFQTLKEIYNGIEFYGEFKKGDKKVYDYYKEKYAKVLNGEAKIIDVKSIYDDGAGRYLADYSYDYDMSELKSAEIYFFDIDEDGLPELCLTGSGTLAIKYIPDTDRYHLWVRDDNYGTRISGSRKMRGEYVHRLYTSYLYYQLDENGDEEMRIAFRIGGEERAWETSYLVSLPQYEDETKEPELQKELKKQMDGGAVQEKYEFRVTEEQYEELTEQYIEAEAYSWRNRVHVSYFFPDMERIYTSCYELPDNMDFADEQTFGKLEEIYEALDFFGELKKGDPEAYEEYRKKYGELLRGDVSFTGDYGVEYKLEEYIKEKLETTSISLYYYDLDEDNLPELYVQGTYGNYVFDYNPVSGQHNLWWEGSPDVSLPEKGKQRYQDITSYGSFYEFYQSNKKDRNEFNVMFGVKEPEEGKEPIYIVSWPLYEDKTGKPKLTKEMKKQGYVVGWAKQYFYRVTKSQYENITRRYFEADTLLLKVKVPLSYFLPEA